MKVLWLANTSTEKVYEISDEIQHTFFGGGWLDGLSAQLLSQPDFNLMLCFPLYNHKKTIEGRKGNFSFCGFSADGRLLRIGRADICYFQKIFEEILRRECPDLIHIHGTEFQYCKAMCSAADKLGILNRVVISIQGLVGIYAEHMYANLPLHRVMSFTARELLTSGNIYSTCVAYKRRGLYERQSIELVSHIMGRTTWDKACTSLYNPKCTYHKSNEILRDVFYNETWSYESCKKHTIFASQAALPIKGAHILLRAIGILKEKYPDILLKIAGENITEGGMITGSSYGIYLKQIIKKQGIEKNIVFIGPQNAQNIKRELMQCNVFVLPSAVENSPNSLGEAMLLGVPCIASDVGGISNMITHCQEGYVYPFDEFYMLAHYIDKVFESAEYVSEMTEKARCRANITHDREINKRRVMEIYKNILLTADSSRS